MELQGFLNKTDLDLYLTKWAQKAVAPIFTISRAGLVSSLSNVCLFSTLSTAAAAGVVKMIRNQGSVVHQLVGEQWTSKASRLDPLNIQKLIVSIL